MNVQEKVAIVTGGASGIGAALAEALVRRDCHVTLVDVDDAGVRQVAQQLSALGPGRVATAVVDVRDRDAIAAVVSRAAESHGRVDLLFNNAGVGAGGATEELVPEHWQRAIERRHLIALMQRTPLLEASTIGASGHLCPRDLQRGRRHPAHPAGGRQPLADTARKGRSGVNGSVPLGVTDWADWARGGRWP